MANNSELATKINIDVEEGIKGLKAIQREVKATTKALKELESIALGYKHTDEFMVKEAGQADITIDNGTDNRVYSVHAPARIVVLYE